MTTPHMLSPTRVGELLDYASVYGEFSEVTQLGTISSHGTTFSIGQLHALIAYKKVLGLLSADFPMPTGVHDTNACGGLPTSAADIRARPLSDFASLAEAINDSDPLMAIFATPEWENLREEGQQWVCGLVRETIARQAEC